MVALLVSVAWFGGALRLRVLGLAGGWLGVVHIPFEAALTATHLVVVLAGLALVGGGHG